MIKKYNNDYSLIEKDFFKRTNLDITSGYNFDAKLNLRVSIVIPTYNNLAEIKKVLIGLNSQYISKDIRDKTEVIIVDDGSTNFDKLYAMIMKWKGLFNIKLAHFKKNQGRSSARNLGVALSMGEILIFLDGDIIPNKFWLISHILRQGLCNNVAMVGFNETINIGDNRILYRNLLINFSRILPSYKKDFRYKKFVPLEWQNTRPEIDKRYFNKSYCILDRSDKFKNFNQNTSFGVWDLPFMLLSGNFSIRRKQFIKAGGFSLDFKGWGMEDTYLGFRFIMNGVFIIPLLSASGFHISNKKHKSGEKLKEFQRNLKIYRNKIKLEPEVFSNKSWIAEIYRRFDGKYSVVDINS